MITKSYSKTGQSCRVTFKIPAGQANTRQAAVLGDWNGWNADTHPMEKRKDGSFSATVTLPAGRPYRFRYLLDGRHWTNDESADAFVSNQYGSEDSVLALDAVAGKAGKKPAPAGKGRKSAAPAAEVRRSAAKMEKAPAKAPRAGKRSEPKEH